MGLSLRFFKFMYLVALCLLSFQHFTISTCSNNKKPVLCNDNEHSALLEFKESLVVLENTSYSFYFDPCRPKFASWKPEEGNIDCCLWDGVKCNEETGHVIKLDLSSSCLYGSINSSSSLFNLVHLRWLNLADNNFNGSEIPSGIMNFSRLSYLNISYSFFDGQIPSEILELSNLVSLDLSLNSLKLQRPSLGNLVDKLINLKTLNLFLVEIASSIPHTLANMSSLTFLSLSDCRLQGKIPSSLGNLTNLVHLDLSWNDLSGKLPTSMGNLVSLEYLDIGFCNFWGKISPSVGNLAQLRYLYLVQNRFSGELPSSIGNLGSLKEMDISLNRFLGELPTSIGNLTSLKKLELLSNGFSGGLPTSMGKLVSLEYLDIRFCNFWGKIPPSLGNLTQLLHLYLGHNGFSGELPPSIGNLNSLKILYISHCNFSGQIPSSVSNLTQLIHLDLSSNIFGGILLLDTFLLKLKNLLSLFLSSNNLSFITKATSASNLWFVGLGSCNLTDFPNFLQNQHQLRKLDLSSNNISGQMPGWLLNVSVHTLYNLNLSHNFLTSFDRHPVLLPWKYLFTLDLSFNKLQGSLPRPYTGIWNYQVSNNNMTGGIPPWICNLNHLMVLDLSYNNLSNVLPQCLGNFSDALLILKLRSNNFSGRIPETFMKGTSLRMIDLNDNLLNGRIPRSLANCINLEFLDLGNNQITDTFPFWLGVLPELNVLILQSNKFHGVIREPKSNCSFPTLRIIDLSHNGFIGKLPSKYFQCWKAMVFVNASQLTYMQDKLPAILPIDMHEDAGEIYEYSLTMSSKGKMLAYEKIPDFLTSIILSNNKFDGEIPASIANLRGLQNLNLSSNKLEGHIPSCLGNLTNIESLDLSNNGFSGRIPQQLAELTFLECFVVSHNHLTGPIPHGTQFDTFANSSFDGNWGLCGKPLSKKCENYSEIAANEDIHDSESPFVFDWKIILIGYTGGLVVGVVLGLNFSTNIREWFVEKFGSQSNKIKRKRRRRN